jgi:antitoxin component YwqK of YwqJK toxin-antitoxin module
MIVNLRYFLLFSVIIASCNYQMKLTQYEGSYCTKVNENDTIKFTPIYIYNDTVFGIAKGIKNYSKINCEGYIEESKFVFHGTCKYSSSMNPTNSRITLFTDDVRYSQVLGYKNNEFNELNSYSDDGTQIHVYFEQGKVKNWIFFDSLLNHNGGRLSFYRNGLVRSQTFMKENLPSGSYSKFDRSGNLRIYGFYNDKKLKLSLTSGEYNMPDSIVNEILSQEDFVNRISSKKGDTIIFPLYSKQQFHYDLNYNLTKTVYFSEYGTVDSVIVR